ncbi:MAG: tetratricopeptide repeat-containing glycosyltransferase family protein [Planctomycetaceae bacterium]|jgi:tetratricopeptide (TPR) repeat protein|nr:tetratricopeptide repeat-containing glycosyltransferase family protein [Planctomycetaceae bacterium]
MTHYETLVTLNAAQDALRQGNVIQAEHRFRELLDNEPHNLHALDGMGMLYCQLGDSKKAISFFLEALEQFANIDPYAINRATINQNNTNTSSSHTAANPSQLCNDNLSLNDKATILLHLGMALRAMGKRNEAIDVLRRAYSIVPNSPEIVLNLGQVHFEQDQVEEAIGCFRLLTELQPTNPSAWLTLGYILSLNGFFREQINTPNIPKNLVQNNRTSKPANIAQTTPQLTNAQNCNNYTAHDNCIQNDFDRSKFDEATEALRMAFLLDKSSPDACFFLAESLRNAERFAESLAFYQQLLPIGNEWPHAVLNYGKSLIALGQLEDGWDAMEFRRIATFGTWSTHQLKEWDRSNTQNRQKTILAYSEESVSATIMFASCLPDLINDVGHCVIECEPSLHKIFQRSFPHATIIQNTHEEIGIESQLPNINFNHNQEEPSCKEQDHDNQNHNSQDHNDQDHDSQDHDAQNHIIKFCKNQNQENTQEDSIYANRQFLQTDQVDQVGQVDQVNQIGQVTIDEQVAFGSLPRYFRRSYDDFPLRKAYLVPDREKVSCWLDRLSEIGDVPKVGVLWQGSWTAETPRQCTIPLASLRNVMLKHQGDAAWVCLQNGSKQKDFEHYRRNVSIRLHLFNEIFQYDLDELSALLTALDLVITPPGYVAHLAGALGVKTWLVLPSGADWRWQIDNGKNEIVSKNNRNIHSNNVTDNDTNNNISDSIWHPAMKVYRKRIDQNWSELFNVLENDIDRFLSKFHLQSDSVKSEINIDEDLPATIKFPSPKTFKLQKSAKSAA